MLVSIFAALICNEENTLATAIEDVAEVTKKHDEPVYIRY
jgi:hypothetical protein